MSLADDCITGLKCVPSVLRSLLRDIPPSKLAYSPYPGAWTIMEHCSHIVDVQSMLSQRIQLFIDNDRPVFIPFNPLDEAYRPSTIGGDLDALLDRFSRERASQVERLQSVDEHVWGRKGEHPEYNDYSFDILIRHILMHDHWHMYRIEELAFLKDEFLLPVV